jgi:hypothetical protein
VEGRAAKDRLDEAFTRTAKAANPKQVELFLRRAEIVACCPAAGMLTAARAVERLRAQSYRARLPAAGLPEWRLAGLRSPPGCEEAA